MNLGITKFIPTISLITSIFWSCATILNATEGHPESYPNRHTDTLSIESTDIDLSLSEKDLHRPTKMPKTFKHVSTYFHKDGSSTATHVHVLGKVHIVRNSNAEVTHVITEVPNSSPQTGKGSIHVISKNEDGITKVNDTLEGSENTYNPTKTPEENFAKNIYQENSQNSTLSTSIWNDTRSNIGAIHNEPEIEKLIPDNFQQHLWK